MHLTFDKWRTDMKLVECFNTNFEPRLWQVDEFSKYRPALQTERDLGRVLSDKRAKYKYKLEKANLCSDEDAKSKIMHSANDMRKVIFKLNKAKEEATKEVYADPMVRHYIRCQRLCDKDTAGNIVRMIYFNLAGCTFDEAMSYVKQSQDPVKCWMELENYTKQTLCLWSAFFNNVYYTGEEAEKVIDEAHKVKGSYYPKVLCWFSECSDSTRDFLFGTNFDRLCSAIKQNNWMGRNSKLQYDGLSFVNNVTMEKTGKEYSSFAKLVGYIYQGIKP